MTQDYAVDVSGLDRRDQSGRTASTRTGSSTCRSRRSAGWPTASSPARPLFSTVTLVMDGEIKLEPSLAPVHCPPGRRARRGLPLVGPDPRGRTQGRTARTGCSRPRRGCAGMRPECRWSAPADRDLLNTAAGRLAAESLFVPTAFGVASWQHAADPDEAIATWRVGARVDRARIRIGPDGSTGLGRSAPMGPSTGHGLRPLPLRPGLRCGATVRPHHDPRLLPGPLVVGHRAGRVRRVPPGPHPQRRVLLTPEPRPETREHGLGAQGHGPADLGPLVEGADRAGPAEVLGPAGHVRDATASTSRFDAATVVDDEQPHLLALDGDLDRDLGRLERVGSRWTGPRAGPRAGGRRRQPARECRRRPGKPPPGRSRACWPPHRRSRAHPLAGFRPDHRPAPGGRRSSYGCP